MNRKLNQKLRPFFDAKTAPMSGPRPAAGADRYLPRGFGPGGGGWGVWDCKDKRFLSDKEVLAISADALMNERLPN